MDSLRAQVSGLHVYAGQMPKKQQKVCTKRANTDQQRTLDTKRAASNEKHTINQQSGMQQACIPVLLREPGN